MKKENKIDLADIFNEAQQRYATVKNWKQFETLYHGWTQQGVRHGRNRQFFICAKRRGWLAKKDADDLRKYIGLV